MYNVQFASSHPVDVKKGQKSICQRPLINSLLKKGKKKVRPVQYKLANGVSVHGNLIE